MELLDTLGIGATTAALIIALAMAALTSAAIAGYWLGGIIEKQLHAAQQNKQNKQAVELANKRSHHCHVVNIRGGRS